jgi:hypothetical protein
MELLDRIKAALTSKDLSVVAKLLVLKRLLSTSESIGVSEKTVSRHERQAEAWLAKMPAMPPSNTNNKPDEYAPQIAKKKREVGGPEALAHSNAHSTVTSHQLFLPRVITVALGRGATPVVLSGLHQKRRGNDEYRTTRS